MVSIDARVPRMTEQQLAHGHASLRTHWTVYTVNRVAERKGACPRQTLNVVSDGRNMQISQA